MIIRLFFFIFLTALPLLLASCKSTDYYKAKVVERARGYAIPRIRDLDQSQIDYVRYAPPLIMDAEVFRRYMTDERTPAKNDIYQTCVVWNIPRLGYSIIVFGVSERRLNDWYPNRVIRKKFIPPDYKKIEATKTAVDYVLNNMLYLSDELRNHVRFAPPLILKTDFQLDIDKNRPKGKMTRKEKDTLAIRKKHLVQYSFIWDTSDPEEKVVVSGVSYEAMDAWEVLSALVRKSSELNEHTLKPKEKVINLDEEHTDIGIPSETAPAPSKSKQGASEKQTDGPKDTTE